MHERFRRYFWGGWGGVFPKRKGKKRVANNHSSCYLSIPSSMDTLSCHVHDTITRLSILSVLCKYEKTSALVGAGLGVGRQVGNGIWDMRL